MSGQPTTSKRRWWGGGIIGLLGLFLLAKVLLGFSGCDQGLSIEYGSRQPIHDGDASLNGTGVLSEMFLRAGHRVATVTRLAPRLSKSADVIVWFIQDFSPPSQAAVDWLETWLEREAGRTLIVVGRDFDAEPLYWSKVAPQANAQQANLVSVKASMAAIRFAGERHVVGRAAGRLAVVHARPLASPPAARRHHADGRRQLDGRYRAGEGSDRAVRPHQAQGL